MFTILTWNVENLFRPSQTASAQEQQRYQGKLALIAQVINNQNQIPDVVALQEVGGLEPLTDLQQACGYQHLDISNFPDGRGIRVAFLSNLPIVDSEDIVDFPQFPQGPALAILDFTSTGNTTQVTRMSRGARRIRVQHGGITIDLITAHLKSKLLTFPMNPVIFQPADEDQRARVAGIALTKRMAEAVTLTARINDFLQGNANNRLILLGDFNDVPEAQTSLILCGPPGSEIGTRGFNMADAGDDQRMFNLTNAILDTTRRYSRIHDGRREMLDQIFVSEELLPQLNNQRQLPVVDSLVDFTQLPSVTNNANLRADDVAPDHAPVIATFNI